MHQNSLTSQGVTGAPFDAIKLIALKQVNTFTVCMCFFLCLCVCVCKWMCECVPGRLEQWHLVHCIVSIESNGYNLCSSVTWWYNWIKGSKGKSPGDCNIFKGKFEVKFTRTKGESFKWIRLFSPPILTRVKSSPGKPGLCHSVNPSKLSVHVCSLYSPVFFAMKVGFVYTHIIMLAL